MVIQVTVTGGKGGTGKSFVAVNITALLSRYYRVVLLDADVEAPNDHILLGLNKLDNEEKITIFLPFINTEKCTKCGVCAKICDTGAILMPPRGYPVVFPRLCSGCMACYYACPYNAIIHGGHVLGYSYVTSVKLDNSHEFTLVTGILREGEEHVPPAVVSVKKRAKSIDSDLLIVDTGAGTGNQISIALQGSRLVLAVTEPTPLGLHDLESILKITSDMGFETWVIINKYGVGDPGKHFKVMKEYGVSRYYTIPYHRDVVESYITGKPIVLYKPDSHISRIFMELVDDIRGVVK